MTRSPRWDPPTTPFTLEHVRPLAVTPEQLRWAERTGRITRLTHGVHIATSALAPDPAGRHLQRALAHQIRNPHSIASHTTAALAWALDLDDDRGAADHPPRFIVSAGPHARSSRTANAITAARTLPTHHRVAHPSGLVVTSAARTAVDVAAEADLSAALVVLDSFTRSELRSLVGERRLRASYKDHRLLERSRRPLVEAAAVAATRRSRRWLERVVPLADPRREAPSESLSFGVIVDAGLPVPALQVRIDTDDGPAYPDFLWEGHRVIGEVDGALKYTNPEALVLEKRRQEALERLGFLVVRWMADEIRTRPWVVVQRIGAALERSAGGFGVSGA